MIKTIRNYGKITVLGVTAIAMIMVAVAVYAVDFGKLDKDNEINAIHDAMIELDKDQYRSKIKLETLYEALESVQSRIELVENHINIQGNKYIKLRDQLESITETQVF